MITSATVLLVEDDELMLAGIHELLGIVDTGYDLTILTAENGKIALDIITDTIPDLIVSDINMPLMSGIELLAHLRQHPQWLSIPVIFLTAQGNDEDIHLAKKNGVDVYITKPFKSNELLELVRSQLDRTFQLAKSHEQIITSLKGDILQILNHELNTPLTYVVAYSELLLDTHDNLEDLSYSYDFLRGIQAGCVRLTRLVIDFIQVIELRTGEAKLAYQKNIQLIEDIVPLLEEALQKSQKRFLPNAVQMSFHPPQQSFGLMGHRESLVSAFERLFDNAIKFTFNHQGSTGEVELFVTQLEDEIQIHIRDEGIGFPPHVYQKIFDLFYQYNRKEYEQQGTGTGLTIAQELIHLHNGRIEVESLPDRGSLFKVILPLYVPSTGNLSPLLEQVRPQATVLVVEDDPHLLSGLEDLLSLFEGKYHLNTLTAANGEEGLAQLAQRRPHLIISDIMMPKMGGLEFLARVRGMDEFVQVPFILLTAKSERQDILHGIVSGAEEYITKPYDSEKLLDLVVVQLDKYFQRQGLLSQNFESLKRSIVQLMSPEFHDPIEVVAENTQEIIGQIKNAHTDDELKSSLQKIRQGSTQLNQLVKYFIALAELTTDEAKTAFDYQARSITDLSYLLQNAISPLAEEQQDNQVVIRRIIAQDLPSVFGVAEKITECVQNLVQFMISHYLNGVDKTILIQAQPVGDEVHIAIEGNRHLSPETLHSLQELLDQKRQAKVDLSGHDAVLQIVHGHIALHNGRIQLSNTPHFTIILILPVETA